MAKKTFETALKDLELIVREMESGDLSLEEAVKKYEKGIKQSKFCMDMLNKAEKKISILTQDQNGKIKVAPITDES